MSRVWPWVRLGVGLGVLVALGARLGAEPFLAGLRAVGVLPVLAALGVGVVTTTLCAGRWCVVARGFGLPLTLGTAVADYYRALLLNAVLPAGVLGDAHRAVSHGRRSGDLGRGVRAVVIERLVGQVVLFAAVGVALAAQPALPAAIAPDPGTVAVVLVVLAVVAVVAALLWRRGLPSARGALVETWVQTRSAVLSNGAIPLVLLLSAAALAGHVGLFVVAARAVGTPAPAVELVPLALAALLVMSLPFTVGGWGPREAFLAMAFGSVGLGAERGLSTAVAYGVLALAASLPGALVLAADYRSRTARHSANAETSSASRALPFSADASEGRPTTPEVV